MPSREAVYRRYDCLMRGRADGLGGLLLLAIDGAPEARTGLESLLRAANIGGAATLLVSGDAQAGRDWARSGVVDFLVATLDEALRILKNELRREQAIAVCLSGQPDALIAECLERGVQPDLYATDCQGPDDATGAGSDRLSQPNHANHDWHMVTWSVPAESLRLLPEVEALAASALETAASAERERWMRRAPQYLGRELARTRSVPMSRLEASRFADALLHSLSQDPCWETLEIWYGARNLLGRHP